jgi:hypothetical protein
MMVHNHYVHIDIESRDTIYLGINFVLAPPPVFDRKAFLQFQMAAAEEGLDTTRADWSDVSISLARVTPSMLDIQVVRAPDPAVGQLLVLAQRGNNPDLFAEEVASVVKAYKTTWPANYQLIQSDATIRDLYDSKGEHAFQKLWEDRLKQSPESLQLLGRPVLGGGLRLVMPAEAQDEEPAEVEIKIESLLADSKKLFIETTFRWPQPTQLGDAFNPISRFKSVDEFIRSRVIPFVVGGKI